MLQTAFGPHSGLSNDILCIHAAKGEGKVRNFKVEGNLKVPSEEQLLITQKRERQQFEVIYLQTKKP